MKLSFLTLSFFITGICSSQNLLVNGGFEEENTCTEYHITCAPEAWISTINAFPNYFKGPGRAHTGTHCFAIEAGHASKPYHRTFVRSRLLCGLRKGAEYRLELYIKSPHAILDSMGVYFTRYDFLFEKQSPSKIKPSVYLKDAVTTFIKSDTNWQKLSLDYRAGGDEGFITIGNFSRLDITGATGISMVHQFYVFLDDLTLTPLNPKEKLCADWESSKADIYEQNERHEYLARLIKMYRSGKMPAPPSISKTSVTRIDTLILPDILFETGKSSLQNGSYAFLDDIIQQEINKQIDSLVVTGHTDNTGTSVINEQLSSSRAKTVADYLAPRISRKGIPVFIFGMADRIPVANNGTPQGKQKNRRVEILVYFREQ